ncbi:hypothetical protein K504DRAFT_69910 [Pleomassaria siparia CBS 279.74]|uniref:Uncharacterized protein n=1 Tax=Pleomassaria siparia CBS 279.74 TaxID=1314801 RepID=A0A6G1K1Z2_9PLEO|nr:hypothetical protein K504DRAFT_69910 [Pleomassaria siparia CBS 279.74]
MFSADLSWTDPDTERVGERRERKAKERSTSSVSPSLGSSRSSKSSILEDRELWWTAGFKKAKALKSSKKGRPDSSHSAALSRKTSSALDRTVKHDQSHHLRDPTLQPEWTYLSSLSTTLPSGASLDTPEYEVPELEGDLSSRCTNSSASPSSRECSKPSARPPNSEADNARRTPMGLEVSYKDKSHRRRPRNRATQSSVLYCSYNKHKFRRGLSSRENRNHTKPKSQEEEEEKTVFHRH